MTQMEFHYQWQWQFNSSPKKLWPLVADTNRFDRDTGLPPVKNVPKEGEILSNTRRRLRLSRFGIPLEWIEEPTEWVEPEYFHVTRRYVRGPVAQLRVLARLHPTSGGGTALNYQVWARPRNLLGYVATPIQIGLLSARSFDQTFRNYDRLASVERNTVDLAGQPVTLAPGGAERLERLYRQLNTLGERPELVERLRALIAEGDDLAVFRMQPYALADYWQEPRRDVLSLFLLATREGLLEFRWDLLCPLCRTAKESNTTLAGITRQVHCDTCQIDYTVNFDRSVELTFRPNPAVRHLPEELIFCTSGPRAMPHVVLQQLLQAGESREIDILLEEGRHRLRTIEFVGGLSLEVRQDGPQTMEVALGPDGWPEAGRSLAPAAGVHLRNETDREQLFVLERLAWTDQAVTAAEVTALQRFRDLFADQALRPGEQISVGNLTILFTDLRESTRLYREIGDAPAFGLVMSHFDVLKEVIAAEEGAIVKTIGDSVMAVFRRPISALRAILAAQQRLAHSGDHPPLFLKAGVHYGPCIAVNLNGRLDYFGSVVNAAARLESFSQGDEVVISQSVYHDPEVASFLEGENVSLVAEAFSATLKGFDQEHFSLWRVRQVRQQEIER